MNDLSVQLALAFGGDEIKDEPIEGDDGGEGEAETTRAAKPVALSSKGSKPKRVLTRRETLP